MLGLDGGLSDISVRVSWERHEDSVPKGGHLGRSLRYSHPMKERLPPGSKLAGADKTTGKAWDEATDAILVSTPKVM